MAMNGGASMGVYARLFVFVVFTQLMQSLMSYDGGATQMSTELLLSNGWSSSELGLLGAMDKFGQVATAFIWSYLLMRRNAKVLLFFGILSKSLCCLGFGVLSSKTPMLMSKLGMGVSEALVSVWATVWVQGHAPDDSKSQWLGLANMSAGLGNGTGAFVAGLFSRRFGYAFAFVLQSIVLFIVWVILIFTPAHWFHLSDKPVPYTSDDEAQQMFVQEEEEEDSEPERMGQLGASRAMSRQGPEAALIREKNDETLSMWHSLKIVISSALWRNTAMAISLNFFITSAVAYLWENMVERVWHFNDEQATLSLLTASGLGGLVGVMLGPRLFDVYLGGFSTNEGLIRCLRWGTYVAWACTVCCTVCASLLIDAAYSLIHYELPSLAGHWLLAAFLSTIFSVFALLTSVIGMLYGINTNAATPETKTVAAGLTQSMQNMIGFAFGPLVPCIVADVAGSLIASTYPWLEEESVNGGQFAIGMAFALLASWPLLCFIKLASCASKYLQT